MADYSDWETYIERRYSSPGGKLVRERQNSNFEDLLEEIGYSEEDSAMEIGAGPAYLSERLGADMAVDIEREPLRHARENGRADEFVQADIHGLPFHEDDFDYTVAPRVFHLDAVDEEEMIDELERVSEKGFVFDYFRAASARATYNWLMHLHEDMPRSNMHTDTGVDMLLEEYDTERSTDFAIPFGFYREEDDPERAKIVEGLQEELSTMFQDSALDFNSVGYRAVDLR